MIMPGRGPILRFLLTSLALGAAGVVLLGWSYLHIGRSRMGDGGPPAASAGTAGTREAHVARARNLLAAADFDGAVAALDRALEIQPEDAEVLALQVRAFRAQRLYGAARSAATRILESYPKSPLAHILLGSIALQEGNAVGARRSFSRAAELDMSSPLGHARLAELDLMEGRVSDARQRADRALALDPDNTTALRVLARIHRSIPDLVSIYDRLLQLAPDDMLSRSWLEVLRNAAAPEVNYLAPLPGDVTVPCERGADGRLYVRARSGGWNLRLLVDTGASGLVVSEKLARRMGMRLREFSESAGLGGSVRHSHPILLSRLDVGGLRARDLMATASNLAGSADGILNPLLFAPPGSGVAMEIRPAQPALLFTRGRPAGRWVSLPYLADGLHAIFAVVLGGRPAMALLDTGAAVEIVDRSVLGRFPGAMVRPASQTGDLLVGFAGQVEDAETVDSVTLRIAGRDFATKHLFVLDLNQEAFRFQIDLDAVIGIGRLAAFDLRIDPSAGQLHFRPN